MKGAGTVWNSSTLYLGYMNCTGVLSITDGASVTDTMAYVGYCGYVGSSPDPSSVTVSGVGSTWVSNSLTLGYNSARGSLTVSQGGNVTTTATACLGNYSGSGSATITGAGSTWTHSGTLSIGAEDGEGSLTIENGGHVSDANAQISGLGLNTRGQALVKGPGSVWNTSGGLAVGNSGEWQGEDYFEPGGSGSLTVADGGLVTAKLLNIQNGQVALRVSGNGMIVLGDASNTGRVTNLGKINLYADPFLAAGTYSPITESAGRTMTWSGSGSCNATGGHVGQRRSHAECGSGDGDGGRRDG